MSETGQKRSRGALFVGAFPIIGPFGIIFRMTVIVAMLVALYLFIIRAPDGWLAEPWNARQRMFEAFALFLKAHPIAYFGPFGLLLLWDTGIVLRKYRLWRDGVEEPPS